MTVNTSPQSGRHCDILNAVSTKFSEEAISKYSSGSNFTDLTASCLAVSSEKAVEAYFSTDVRPPCLHEASAKRGGGGQVGDFPPN
jgi:hypothetical protein